MTFEPKPGMRINLIGETIQFTSLESSGPAAVFVYAEAGKEGTIYKVLKGKEYYALKVFYPEYQDKRLIKNTKRLNQFKHLKGFRVAERIVINRKSFSEVVDKFPELDYSVLMPWIQGTVWGNLMIDDQPLQREEYFQIAQSLMVAVYGLEVYGLAHCDLSNNNFIINPMLSSIELIDIEDMYAPDMPRPIPDISYGTAGYRTKWIAENGLWGPDSDRFASAVLCSEILTWHDKEIRKNKAGNASYFDEAEIGENTERYQLMKECLSSISNDLPVLFEKAWFSEGSDHCPLVADWMNAVEKIGPSILKAKEETEMPQDKDLSKRRTKIDRKNEYTIPNDIAPKMEISASILDFGILQFPEIVLEFSISNTGGSVLNGNINSTDWIETSPSRISIQPGETQIVEASLNDKFPRPKSGFEYRTPDALVIESNTGIEVIGARYRLAKPSLHKSWLASLIVGSVVIVLYVVRPIVKPDPTSFLVYFGITGIIVGLTIENIKSFRNYREIIKAVGINALIIILIFAIFYSKVDYDKPKLARELISNSIFLIVLMLLFANAVRRDNINPEKKVVKAEERKVAKRKPVRLRPTQETAKKSVYQGEYATQQSSVGIVYVFADDGTPLYRSLPASNNWIGWLEKGSELSTVLPVEDVISSLSKYGHYIEVVDKNGNKGFVTATAVKMKRSKK
jgi:hypothetical protein